jgi:hypothetical protein
MRLTALGAIHLRYTRSEYVDFGQGGQFVGSMEGTFEGRRLHGDMWLVNAPPHRPDGVNAPAISGVLFTRDGAKVYVEMHGLAVVQPLDATRVFTTSLLLRSGDSRYGWVNSVVGVV